MRVSATDPQAVVQPRKDGVFCPAYRPSIIVDEHRLVVGLYMSPSSEQEALWELLRHHVELFGSLPRQLLVDGGYRDLFSLKLFSWLELDAYCTLGQKPKPFGAPLKMRQGKYDKSEFTYDRDANEYTCPAGKRLVQVGRGFSSGQVIGRYQGIACSGCPVRAKCTGSPLGRFIKRYESDAYREAMAEKIASPQAQELLKERAKLVEPVFAELKERQGQRRLRRRGLVNVAGEFAMWCLAYNIGRALSMLRAAKEAGR